MTSPPVLAVQVGNTRVQLGLLLGGMAEQTFRFANTDIAAIVAEAVRLWDEIKDEPQAAVMLASVNEKAAVLIESSLEDQLGVEIYRIGDDVPVPIGEALDPETLVGVDRLLNAAAAWDRLKQACVIIDAGTAVTVDFVDGEGTFHGGAIAPGLAMQLKALHQHTDALPAIEFRKPTGEAWGRNTVDAMLRGVYEGVRGLAWRLVERYAEQYGAFPLVIATGGDADALFGEDELVNRIVPDLTLQGMAVAARHALAADERDSADGESAGEGA
ncbi:MAG: type III pantothenate kinase [Phycisphaerae bacterium]|jgi:type III pantothenate kinase|nr:type III pantothenate kinase [Phycisphaerae bacterium]